MNDNHLDDDPYFKDDSFFDPVLEIVLGAIIFLVFIFIIICVIGLWTLIV